MDNDKQNQQKSRVNLASLYPTPKSFKQREADQQKRELRRKVRLPRHINFAAAIRLSILYGFTLCLVMVIPQIVSWNPFSGVFICFLLSLVWFGLAWLTIRVVTDTIEVRGNNPAPLVMAYVASSGPLVALGVAALTNINLLIGVVILHFLIVYFIMVISFATRIPNIVKAIILISTWIVMLVLAVLIYSKVFN